MYRNNQTNKPINRTSSPLKLSPLIYMHSPKKKISPKIAFIHLAITKLPSTHTHTHIHTRRHYLPNSRRIIHSAVIQLNRRSSGSIRKKGRRMQEAAQRSHPFFQKKGREIGAKWRTAKKKNVSIYTIEMTLIRLAGYLPASTYVAVLYIPIIHTYIRYIDRLYCMRERERERAHGLLSLH